MRAACTVRPEMCRTIGLTGGFTSRHAGPHVFRRGIATWASFENVFYWKDSVETCWKLELKSHFKILKMLHITLVVFFSTSVTLRS